MFDDLWSECTRSTDVVKAFKVFSRKKNVSLIIISQSYFSGGEGGREIRNNVDVIALFENHGDMGLNGRIMRKLGYYNSYKIATKDLAQIPHSYIVINLSAKLQNKIMRVATNLFQELNKFTEFFY